MTIPADLIRAKNLLERMTIEWNPQDGDLDILAKAFAAVRAEERETRAKIAEWEDFDGPDAAVCHSIAKTIRERKDEDRR